MSADAHTVPGCTPAHTSRLAADALTRCLGFRKRYPLRCLSLSCTTPSPGFKQTDKGDDRVTPIVHHTDVTTPGKRWLRPRGRRVVQNGVVDADKRRGEAAAEKRGLRKAAALTVPLTTQHTAHIPNKQITRGANKIVYNRLNCQRESYIGRPSTCQLCMVPNNPSYPLSQLSTWVYITVLNKKKQGGDGVFASAQMRDSALLSRACKSTTW
ncbi:hypothetical protein Bbelb_058280 [Branchiostoma belcheri]|nr:hypothetical protein Bbelb_058280 [Branchiostoma belcheri]